MVESVGNLEHIMFIELASDIMNDGFGLILGTKEKSRAK